MSLSKTLTPVTISIEAEAADIITKFLAGATLDKALQDSMKVQLTIMLDTRMFNGEIYDYAINSSEAYVLTDPAVFGEAKTTHQGTFQICVREKADDEFVVSTIIFT